MVVAGLLGGPEGAELLLEAERKGVLLGDLVGQGLELNSETLDQLMILVTGSPVGPIIDCLIARLSGVRGNQLGLAWVNFAVSSVTIESVELGILALYCGAEDVTCWDLVAQYCVGAGLTAKSGTCAGDSRAPVRVDLSARTGVGTRAPRAARSRFATSTLRPVVQRRPRVIATWIVLLTKTSMRYVHTSLSGSAISARVTPHSGVLSRLGDEESSSRLSRHPALAPDPDLIPLSPARSPRTP